MGQFDLVGHCRYDVLKCGTTHTHTNEEMVLRYIMLGGFDLVFIITFIKVLLYIYSVTGDVNEMLRDTEVAE